MHTAARTAIATLAFAVIHSALATRQAKRAAASLLGAERAAAAYRVFYVAQGLLSFGALAAYCASLPTRTVYRIRGPGALLMRAGQAAGALQLLSGLREIGFRRWAGIDRLQAWRRGLALPAAPAAQGPECGDDGMLLAGGPFRYSRHPLNFAGVPLFWLTPHMTTRRLAFSAVGSAYLMIGSLHEEARLREAYGGAYDAWLRSGVPFFWPAMRPRAGSAELKSTATPSLTPGRAVGTRR
ncbi:methyltransferase family protein [Noviherbaspirillum aridicola]|uniref:NnrU domain-containing protein n=1 Tax=Noviherbaspirillum aridicola TaxID=2849687 RepID=A0ABQ4PZF3_9BURK|nr:hypothetical protein [Noviherbaspirillum aridicola]GIZ50262.1 hypothetical protein NCCP691_02760 [Noviherbaspirillum aridicola]